jgi:hypothetical protein
VRPRELEDAFGPGGPDVEESPLLVELRLSRGASIGQLSLLEPGQKHDLKLETLGGPPTIGLVEVER